MTAAEPGRSLEFSVGLWGMQSFKHAPRHHVDLYREMVEDACYAEALGFSHFWLTEHHFWYDGYCPSLIVGAAAVAARTSRMRVGTSMLLLPLHDPLRVAQAAAMADIVSGGRFDLGVAVGYRHAEFDAFGVARSDRGARMEEALDILHLAWTTDRFSYHGRFFDYEDVSVTPKPLQRPIPIWIGGWAERVVRRAARRGLNLMGPSGDALRLYHEQLGGWGFFTNPVTRQPVFFDQPAILNNPKTDKEVMLPPGPNGPVGVAWLDLTKEHYGIHGTNEPQTIGRAESSGCIRMTNWDVLRLSRMMKPGFQAIFQA